MAALHTDGKPDLVKSYNMQIVKLLFVGMLKSVENEATLNLLCRTLSVCHKGIQLKTARPFTFLKKKWSSAVAQSSLYYMKRHLKPEVIITFWEEPHFYYWCYFLIKKTMRLIIVLNYSPLRSLALFFYGSLHYSKRDSRESISV